jgi:signal transduction histidine kinase
MNLLKNNILQPSKQIKFVFLRLGAVAILLFFLLASRNALYVLNAQGASLATVDSAVAAQLARKYWEFYGKGAIADYHKAQQVANQLFKYGERLGNKEMMATAYYQIGLIYDTLQDDLEEAIDNYQKSYRLFRAANQVEGVSAALAALGVVYIKLERYEKAQETYSALIAYLKDNEDLYFLPSKINAYIKIASLYERQNNINKALALMDAAFGFLQKCNNCSKILEQEAYYNYGLILKKQRNYAKAILTFEKSLAALDTSYRLHYRDHLKHLATCYEKIGNFQKAIALLREAYDINNLIYKEINKNQLNNFRIQFEIEKKENEIKLQKAEIEAQNVKSYLLYSISGGVFVTALLFGFGWWQKKKNAALLAKKNISLTQAHNDLSNAFAQIQRQKQELAESLELVKRQQEELVATQKLAALGELSANISHELNTPLAAIQSVANLYEKKVVKTVMQLLSFADKLSDAEKIFIQYGLEKEFLEYGTKQERILIKALEESLGNNRQAARDLLVLGISTPEQLCTLALDIHTEHFPSLIEWLADTRRQTLAFANISKSVKKTSKVIELINWLNNQGGETSRRINLLACLKGILENFASSWSQNIKLSVEALENVEIWGSEKELNFIFFQLVQNAIQAMGGEGSISVSVLSVSETAITLCFQDSGPGIPEEAQAKLFAPFYSEKKQGEGIGLGLYIAKKMLNQRQGDIRLVPIEKGARFEIVLPLAY